MTHLYCVVYRTGGTDNFQWHRSSAMLKAEAERSKRETERKGYKALVERYDRSINIGLPEGYTA
jgi:hypothetical protein